jgi:type II secretory pathway pseudopilin PulG
MNPRRRIAIDDDRGDTLVELLVAIVIMGLVFVVVLSGIGTAVVGAAVQRSLTTVNAALASAGGALAADAYVPCAGRSSYDLGTPPSGYAFSVTSVQYWDGVSAFVPACADPDNGLQQLTIRVVHAGDDASVHHDRVVVKRDAS